MNMMSKLAGLAQKALDKNGSTTPGATSGGSDWRSMVRSAADAITGDGQAESRPRPQPQAPAATTPVTDADRAAIARYDYLMETADPRQIEQVHREAFDRLSPEQRGLIQQRMNAELPAHEHPRSASADELARTAARTEASRPGMLRGLLARATGQRSGGGAGRAAMIGGAGLAAGGVLAAVAGGAVVSSVAGPLLEQATNLGVDFESLASGLDLGAITGIDELATGAGEAVSGFGDQLGELGSNFEIPGLGDFFGR